MGNDKKPAPPPQKTPPADKPGTAGGVKPASKGSTTQRPPQR